LQTPNKFRNGKKGTKESEKKDEKRWVKETDTEIKGKKKMHIYRVHH
jgi:hypothetical protein